MVDTISALYHASEHQHRTLTIYLNDYRAPLKMLGLAKVHILSQLMARR